MLRGAIDHRCTSISHLKQLIFIKSRRQLLVRNFAHLGTSSVNWDHHGPLCFLIVQTALIHCWDAKSPRFFTNRSYFRRFTVKIRSFAIFGALNPPKCPNKRKKKNDSALFLCKQKKKKNRTYVILQNGAYKRSYRFCFLLNYKALKLAIENIMLYLRYLFL